MIANRDGIIAWIFQDDKGNFYTITITLTLGYYIVQTCNGVFGHIRRHTSNFVLSYLISLKP